MARIGQGVSGSLIREIYLVTHCFSLQSPFCYLLIKMTKNSMRRFNNKLLIWGRLLPGDLSHHNECHVPWMGFISEYILIANAWKSTLEPGI